MLLANAGLLLGGLFWGWLATIAGLHLTFHIATLAIMLSMPLCLNWSLDPVDRMRRLAVRESSCNLVDLVGRDSNQVIQVTFDFKVPAEATQRFEGLVTQAQTRFSFDGAHLISESLTLCPTRATIASRSSFLPSPGSVNSISDQGAKVSEAWKQTKECAVQTEYKLALIHYPSPPIVKG